ncbi:MAG TPA: Hsp20/alpha crystallin family protein [Thermoanaerobaculia bacterium]|nr:Hsp20/alpha crystallin family protein [Thermoanaerobaculia bacterium]
MPEIRLWNRPASLFTPTTNRLMDEFLTDAFAPAFSGEDVRTREWLPAVDIREDDNALKMFVEVPGMDRKDVNLSIEDNVLTVSGERRFEKDVEKEEYHRIERAYGTFSRSFTLPRNVDPEKVKATYKDGVLTIELPKVEEAKPRKIAIS